MSAMAHAPLRRIRERSNPPTQEQLREARVARHGAEQQAKLEAAHVGIAGLGGLGSLIAIHLARAGVGTLVLADFDHVDITNLHRQQYDASQVGMAKTDALAERLRAIDPFIELELHPVRITADNAREIFTGCTVVCEAFDQADQKVMLVETLLEELPGTPIVSASGMAGLASANTIQTTHPLRDLYLCGDASSDVEEMGTLIASRVGVCASHQANMVLRLILGETEP